MRDCLSHYRSKFLKIGYLNPKNSQIERQGWNYDRENKPATVFYVHDNGIGIQKKYLDIIFRIFKRLHGKDKYGGGTGVGLTIARKMSNVTEEKFGQNQAQQVAYFTLH